MLTDYFKGMNTAEFFERLDARGREMNIRFGPQTRMSNSRLAMEAGEFAKANGTHDAFHEAVFKAFFTDCKDIGSRDVILDVAKQSGLDTEKLDTALDTGLYLPRLEETTRMARANFINSAPTFVIDGYETIVGAQPMETFRQALAKCA